MLIQRDPQNSLSVPYQPLKHRAIRVDGLDHNTGNLFWAFCCSESVTPMHKPCISAQSHLKSETMASCIATYVATDMYSAQAWARGYTGYRRLGLGV